MTGAAVAVLAAGLGRAAVAALLLGALGLIGWGLLPERVRPRHAVHAVPLALSLGMLASGWLSFLAGTALGTWAIAAVWGLLLAWGARSFRPYLRAVRRAARRLALLSRAAPLVSLALAAAVAALLPQLLLPLVDSDGIRYQVAHPRLFLLTGHVTTYPWDVTGFFPQTAGMLYLVATALAGGETAKWVHAGFFVAELAVLALLAYEAGRSRRAAMAAPLLLAAAPVAALPATAAFVDHIGAFHLLVGALLVGRRGARPPGLCGVTLAAAFATKLTTAPGAAGVALAATFGAPRGRRGETLAMTALLGILAFAPFAVRNLVWTSDPIYPVGHGLLHVPIPGVSSSSLVYATNYRPVATGPLGLAWLSGEPGAGVDDVVGIQSLAGLFLLLVVVPVRRARPLLGLVVPFLLVGLLWHPPARYLIPMFAGLAVVSAVALGRWLGRWAGVAAVVLSLPALATSARALATQFGPADYLSGRVGREAFLARTVPGYRAARFLDRLPPGGVMALDYPGPYYLDRPFVVEGILNDPPLRRWLASGASAADLVVKARALGVRYLLVTPGYGGGTRWSLLPVAPDPSKVPVVAAFRARLKLLATVDGVDVYELPAR